MNDKERLDELFKVIDNLIEYNVRIPAIVEGRKDVKAMRSLGLKGVLLSLNYGIPLFNFCEEVAKEHTEVIILTDWDSRGGRLAKTLRDGLAANGVKYDSDYRAKLARLCKKEIKDIEALPKFLAALKRKVGRNVR